MFGHFVTGRIKNKCAYGGWWGKGWHYNEKYECHAIMQVWSH